MKSIATLVTDKSSIKSLYMWVISYHFNYFFTWPSWISLKLGINEALMVIWIYKKFQLDSLYGFLISTNCNITAFVTICTIQLLITLLIFIVLENQKNTKLKLNKCSFLWYITLSALYMTTNKPLPLILTFDLWENAEIIFKKINVINEWTMSYYNVKFQVGTQLGKLFKRCSTLWY